MFIKNLFLSIYLGSVSDFMRSLRSLKKSGLYRFTMQKGRIRLIREIENQKVYFCPVTAVVHFKTGEVFDAIDYKKAVKLIGLSERKAKLIVESADWISFDTLFLRNRMINLFKS